MNDAYVRGATWWITLRALYGQPIYTEEFQDETGAAAVPDPDPGSYLVSVLSTEGYSCFKEIDLAESTRHWTFDPATCSFEVDASAHLVSDEDKRQLKSTGWYRELRKRDEQLFRSLQNAAKASAEPDSLK